MRQRGPCTQSLKDVLLTDDNESILVSIWEEHFDNVESSLFYKFRAMKLCHFNEIALSSQNWLKLMHLVHLMLQ